MSRDGSEDSVRLSCVNPSGSPVGGPHAFIQRTAAFIHAERMIPRGCSLAVGVSGGPDSVALLHVLSSLQNTLAISRILVVHFNHQLRGRASEADQEFVAELATQLGLDFATGTEDVAAFAAEAGVSLEMAGRVCRHRFFQETLTSGQADRIALAHTANDQAEEVLLRLFRGTGPAGMVAMLPATDQGIIRPLLFAWRDEILAYLDASGQIFREDASNAVPSCQRNVLRLELFPLIEQSFHGRVREALVRHAGLARDEEAWWETQVESHWEGVCQELSENGLQIDCGRLAALHPALQRRLLRHGIARIQGHLQRIYTVHVEALRALACETHGTRSLDLPGRLRARKEGSSLILSPSGSTLSERSTNPHPPAIFHEPGQYDLPSWEWTLRVRRTDEQGWSPGLLEPREPTGEAFEVCMDADALVWPLCVRTWTPGDRFRPLGSGGSQKLQDFFVNAKVERSRRRQVPLLCDQEKICWVLGMRLDDRVKVTPLTERVLEIRVRSRSLIP